MRERARALMTPTSLATFLHHGETTKHLPTSQASYMLVRQIYKQKGRKGKERREGKYIKKPSSRDLGPSQLLSTSQAHKVHLLHTLIVR